MLIVSASDCFNACSRNGGGQKRMKDQTENTSLCHLAMAQCPKTFQYDLKQCKFSIEGTVAIVSRTTV